MAIGGLAALVALVLYGKVQGQGNPLAAAVVGLAFVGYALVAIVAIAPGITKNLGSSLTALRCEAILRPSSSSSA